MSRFGCLAGRAGSPGARLPGPFLGMLLLSVLSIPAVGAGPAPPVSLANRVRQPVALAFSRDGGRLFVANRRGGSLSVIDPGERKVVGEDDVGRGLADLAVLADGRLLAVDQAGAELLLLEVRGDRVRAVDRREVSPDPVTVLAEPGGKGCVVASLWSRRLTFVDVAADGLRTAGTLDLPFPPRNMVLVRGGSKLVAAEAFGGRIAVIDVKRRAVDSFLNLPAHNIRGLAASPDGRTLAVAHQALNEAAPASREDVHWGLLLRNQLRVLQTGAVLEAGTDEALLAGSQLLRLGGPEDGAGDPAGVAYNRQGDLVVALAGVGEVAIGLSPDRTLFRTTVGRRPSAVAPSPDGATVYVANTFDDSVSAVDVETGRVVGVIDLGPRPEPSLAERGERLFFDATLSHDGWMSCHSCHTDGHSNGLRSDTQGDGSYGAPKRVPSLLGVGATSPWAWAGTVGRLEDQVRRSIETTMGGDPPSAGQVEALAAYLRTLVPPPPAASASEEQVARGRAVFAARGCARCHAPPEYTRPGRFDVGLRDEVGNRAFNPPSLRGVGQREPLLHDGRARDLGTLFERERHPRGTHLSPREVADLVAFLKTL